MRHPTLCDHIHLPVQSGSTAVLKAMAREYTREWYLERMSWIKAATRDISITSDMIVGFPGETDADFEETITLVGEVKYDAVFAFKFSPRPNTPAVTMSDSIPDEVKTRAAADFDGPAAGDSARALWATSGAGAGVHGGELQSGARSR